MERRPFAHVSSPPSVPGERLVGLFYFLWLGEHGRGAPYDISKITAEHPDAGDLIRHSGGLRKIRWSGSGRGKRGGTRTIYYWDAGDRILMLYLYKKNERSDLTPAQLAVLKAIVEDFKK